MNQSRGGLVLLRRAAAHAAAGTKFLQPTFGRDPKAPRTVTMDSLEIISSEALGAGARFPLLVAHGASYAGSLQPYPNRLGQAEPVLDTPGVFRIVEINTITGGTVASAIAWKFLAPQRLRETSKY